MILKQRDNNDSTGTKKLNYKTIPIPNYADLHSDLLQEKLNVEDVYFR